jgi:hypothetical protein
MGETTTVARGYADIASAYRLVNEFIFSHKKAQKAQNDRPDGPN